ncbi:hypothetical protein ScPMuIL_014519 [Solemya velum]
MAALRLSMCFIPKIGPSHHRIVLQKCLRHHLNKRHYSLAFLSRTVIDKAYRIETITPLCLYSTHGSGVKGLTDEILKSKTTSEQENQSGNNKQQSSESEGSDKKDSKWTGKNAWKMGLIFLSGWSVLTAAGMLYIWGSPLSDPEGKPIIDEFTELPILTAYIKRAASEFSKQKQMIVEPSRERLLPDPLQYPYVQPPYTLVIEMTNILVHPEWTYGTGWRFKKRQFVDYFLQQVGPPLFEVVVYTGEQGFNADPILNNLDPQGYIMYRLYRDATRYMNGHHVKDLSCLNRDMSKVIIVDWNEKSFQLQKENAFNMEKWTGEDDRSLIDLGHFLRAIAASGVEDVRTVLKHYQQFDQPLEAFKENQRKLQEEQEKQAKQLQEQGPAKKGGYFQLGGFLKR